MSILGYIILIYLLYQLIFRLIIPIWRTTRQVKRGFRDMQERMNGFGRQQETPTSATVRPSNSKPPKQGDYIDFEEVKD